MMDTEMMQLSEAPERSEGDSESSRPAMPDPEVEAKATRRRFTAEYKLRVLGEADACKNPGELGALLRREGLYSSHLSTWRKQRRQAMAAKKRGRKARQNAEEQRRISELERENRDLRRRLKQAEAVIEVQKKLSEILGVPLKSPESDGSD
jgi:transposase-like protein